MDTRKSRFVLLKEGLLWTHIQYFRYLKTRRVYIHGLIHFPQDISMPGKFMGKEYRVTVAGVDGWLCTPALPENLNNSSQHALLAPVKQKEVFVTEFYWGSIHSWPSGDGVIRACGIVFDVHPNQIVVKSKAIAGAIADWRLSLIEIISVFWATDFRKKWDADKINIHGAGLYELFYRNEVGKHIRVHEQDDVRHIAVSVNRYSIEDDALEKAAAAASLLYRTRLPYLYLLDAEFAERQKQYRRTVLDAATALEVCLSHIIDDAVKDLPKKLADDLVERNSSLPKKRTLLQLLSVPLKYEEKDYQNKVDRLRNHIIHAGRIPSAVEAASAFRMVSDTIKQLMPDPFVREYATTSSPNEN